MKMGLSANKIFGKLKEKIAPESSEMMHSLTDPAGNEITEPQNIKYEYYREFQHRVRKREGYQARASRL